MGVLQAHMSASWFWFCRQSSDCLAKFYSLYFHLAKIHSLKCSQLQQSIQIGLHFIFNTEWVPHVILTLVSSSSLHPLFPTPPTMRLYSDGQPAFRYGRPLRWATLPVLRLAAPIAWHRPGHSGRPPCPSSCWPPCPLCGWRHAHTPLSI